MDAVTPIEGWTSSFRPLPAEPAWLGARREAALAGFVGLPTTKVEAWHYTSVKKLVDAGFAHGEATVALDALAAWRDPEADAEVVIVSGRVVAARGDVGVRRFADAVADPAAGEALAAALGATAGDADPFTALNTALLQDGVVLHVPDGARLGRVHVLMVAAEAAGPTLQHVRNLITLGRHAEATLVETHVALGGVTLTNAVTEVVVGPGARLRHLVVGEDAGASSRVVRTAVRLGRDARYAATNVWLGGALVRQDAEVTLAGEGAEVVLDGAFVTAARDHVDNRTRVLHDARHTTLREAYRGVLGGRSKGVFDGTVVVAPGAIKTDADQSSRNLLLTDHAEANAKPNLEIQADDVRCSHGTTVGRLDPVQLVYLRSRGIPEREARRILTRAFLADVVGRIEDDDLRARVTALVDAKLDAAWEDAS